MIKVKDGYGKLIGTTYQGISDRVLLSNGGDFGLHIGRNNEANKIVRTDASGYIQAGWINTTSGNRGTTAINKIYCSNDDYIRYKTPANFFESFDNSGNQISLTIGSYNRKLTVNYAVTSNVLNNLGNRTAISGTTIGESGLRLYKVYDNGYPVTFGNILNIGGSGYGELLFQWTHNSNPGHLYYRSKRDMNSQAWSNWVTILDNNNYSSTLDSRYVTLTTNQTVSGVKTFNTQQKFTVATGTSPFTVSSTTVVSNLNADLLDGQHGSRYLRALGGSNYITFTVGGNADTYYPVIISSVGDYYPLQFVNISRTFSEQAPDSWNTAIHRGGLTLTLLWNGSRYWDGNGSGGPCHIVYLYQSYCTMFGGKDTSTSGEIVWLRGGGAVYHVHAMNGTSVTATVHTSTYTDVANNVFTPITTPKSYSIRWPGYADGADIATRVSKNLIFSPGRFSSKTYNGSSETSINIPTHTSHLINDSGYWTGTKYWANIAVSSSSSTSTSPTFANVYGGNGFFNWVGANTNKSFSIGANNGHAIYIPTNNNVGIGISSPAQKLHIAGLARLDSNGAYLMIGPQNSSYTHYNTNAFVGHWFNKTVEIQGICRPYGNNAYSSGDSSNRWSNVYSYAGDFVNNLTVGGNKVWHAGNDGSGSGLDADLLDGYHRQGLYSSIPEWISANRYTKSIVINGDSSTYYSVVIDTPISKEFPGFISIWKNLSSQTASYPGNHSNGTASMWLLYEGRKTFWDGNGGYLRCLYHSMPYSALCAKAEVAGNGSGRLVVYLRGGGTQYYVSTTYDAAVDVYMSHTNIESEQYPVYVTPTSTLGNLGILSTTYVGYGNITGSSASVRDISNAQSTTFAYSKPTMTYGDFTYLAGWNGYELRTINKNIFSISDHNHNSSYVTSLGTNENYLTWTKNGTTNNITVPYASNAGYTTRLYANSTSNLTTAPGEYSLSYARFQAGASNSFPTSNNANGVITVHTHTGNYYAQIGLSSNGRMYHRFMSSQSLSAGVGWNTVAWLSDLTWGNISGKPSSFTPLSHTHPISQITGLQAALDSKSPTTHTHDFFQIQDAANEYINAETIRRKVIVCNTKNGNGYISRAAIGLSNPNSQFSPVLISVGTNDRGTTWTDFSFNPTGRLVSKVGTFAVLTDTIDNADKLDGYHASEFSYKSWWHWSGQSGQPTWLWGGNSENSYYVYNPSNFRVSYANSAGNADTLDGLHANSFQTTVTSTKRDFIHGTLIKTNINYANANGDPFYLEIKGNIYTRLFSCYTQIQGYIYDNTIINHGVTHIGAVQINGLIAMNLDGNLCFWFPRQGYWEGYSIFCASAHDYRVNKIISILDTTDPGGSKRVVLNNVKTNAYISDLTWNNISGKPSSFTPSSHTHKWIDITEKPNWINSTIGSIYKPVYFNAGIPTVCQGYVKIISGKVSSGEVSLYYWAYRLREIVYVWGYLSGNGTSSNNRQIIYSSMPRIIEGQSGASISKGGGDSIRQITVYVSATTLYVKWNNINQCSDQHFNFSYITFY